MGAHPDLSRRNAVAKLKALQGAVKVAELYCQGVPCLEIAKRLGVKPVQVYSALKRAKQLWREKMAESAEAVKAEQLAKLDKIEAEAWAAWQRSKKDAIERMRRESVSAKFGRKSETGQKKIHRDGEAKYLDIVMRTIRQRLELLGILNPETQAPTGNGSTLLEVVVSTKAEADRLLNYSQFAQAANLPAIEADSVTPVEESSDDEP